MKSRVLVFKNPSLRNLWIGLTISTFGDSLYNLATAWYIFNKTGSSFQVGLEIVCMFVPTVLLGVPFGVLVDRYNRKLLMQLAQILQIIATLVLTIALAEHFAKVWMIYVVAIVVSSATAIFRPGQTAWLRTLVDRDHLITASSLLSSSTQMMSILGAVTGGAIVAFLGTSTAVGIDVASFVIALICIQLTPSREARKAASSWRWSVEMAGGFHWLRRHRTLFGLLLIATVSNVALGPTNVLAPMLIKNVLHARVNALGIFDASLGVGLVISAIIIGWLRPQKLGLWFAMGMGIETIGMVLISVAPNLYVAVAGNFVLGLGIEAIVIPFSTMFQVLVPNELRGRISGTNNTISSVAIPITYGVVGTVGDKIGVGNTFLIAAAMNLLSTLITLFVPPMRSIRMDGNEPTLSGATSSG